MQSDEGRRGWIDSLELHIFLQLNNFLILNTYLLNINKNEVLVFDNTHTYTLNCIEYKFYTFMRIPISVLFFSSFETSEEKGIC